MAWIAEVVSIGWFDPQTYVDPVYVDHTESCETPSLAMLAGMTLVRELRSDPDIFGSSLTKIKEVK